MTAEGLKIGRTVCVRSLEGNCRHAMANRIIRRWLEGRQRRKTPSFYQAGKRFLSINFRWSFRIGERMESWLKNMEVEKTLACLKAGWTVAVLEGLFASLPAS